jgi:hypothetical protein
MTHPGFLFDVSMASDTSKSLHVFEDCMTCIGKKVNVTSSAEMSSRPLEMRAMSELFCPSDYRRPADSRSMEGLAAVISNLLSPIMFRKSLATAQLVTFQSPLIKSNIPDLSGEQDFRRLMEAVFSHK